MSLAGTSILIEAIHTGHYSIVQRLLQSGANANIVGRNEVTPLAVAVECENEAVVRLLLDRRADVNLRERECVTAVVWAN